MMTIQEFKTFAAQNIRLGPAGVFNLAAQTHGKLIRWEILDVEQQAEFLELMANAPTSSRTH